MEKLASVQIITDIKPIQDADNIVLAFILGWQVVIRKNEFNIGDKVCYIQIDTIVPELPEYEFLRERKFKVKTIKLRKQISQGLIIPLPNGKWKEGEWKDEWYSLAYDVNGKRYIEKFGAEELNDAPNDKSVRANLEERIKKLVEYFLPTSKKIGF